MHRGDYVLGDLGQAEKSFSKLDISRVGRKLAKALPKCHAFVSELVGAGR